MATTNIRSGTDAVAVNYDRLAAELELIARQGAPSCDDRTRARLLESVKAALPELEKHDDALQRILYTSVELVAAKIALNLDLFNKLTNSEKPLSTEEIAKPVAADVPYMQRILKFIACTRLIKEVDVGLFGPSTTTRHFADRGSAGGIFHNFDNLGPSWQAFPDWLERTNYQPPNAPEKSSFSQGQRTHLNLFDWFAENPKNLEEFGHWMTVQRFGDELWLDTLPIKTLVLDNADPHAPLFIDVGGGIGHQCATLIKAYPSFAGRTILQDQAHVLKDALLIEGMTTQAIDFFESQPVKNARVYYLRNVLHDWSDDFGARILKNIKAAMGPNSMIFIDEMVVPDKGAHRIAVQLDMTMLTACAAEERSEARWKSLLDASGLKLKERFQYQDILGDSITVVIPA